LFLAIGVWPAAVKGRLMSFSKAYGLAYLILGELFLFSSVSAAHYLIFPREEVRPLVTRIPGNVHSSFTTRREAERAYALAYALGSVRVLQHPNDPTPSAPAPAAAMPMDVMRAWEQASDNFLGAEWHVVFKGKCTGIFPSWQVRISFASSHFLILCSGTLQQRKPRAFGALPTKSIPLGRKHRLHMIGLLKGVRSRLCSFLYIGSAITPILYMHTCSILL
jgi:hypothetical protein